MAEEDAVSNRNQAKLRKIRKSQNRLTCLVKLRIFLNS